MDFDPNNKIVQLCLKGMELEDQQKPAEAATVFLQAWDAASNDFERFTAAHYVARHQSNARDRLQWLQKALRLATGIDNNTVKGALSSLHANIAQCYEDLGDDDNARKHRELSYHFQEMIYDTGPFYHGTRADLKTGDLLSAGYGSNYHAGIIMNHIYFTALVNGAGLAAALASGEGRERVYIVEPTGPFENDPNVTDKKFPGNPTRSYRSQQPLKILGEVTDWARLTPEQVKQWKEKLARSRGEIIN
ncbi:MAG: NAD(+)--rifampin ADP-ribosyltransferase [Chitinophagaceae bacterium]|nr:MAG: NAD(+)--rifampin ADP-ribosyltransferase [Chitinophagaceae bacterium]